MGIEILKEYYQRIAIIIIDKTHYLAAFVCRGQRIWHHFQDSPCSVVREEDSVEDSSMYLFE